MTVPQPSSPGASIPARNPGLAPAHRQRVVDLLQLRFADDHLSMDEFERRVAAAYQAGSPAELDALVADLAPAAAATTVPDHGRIAAIFSNSESSSSMPVPRHLEIETVFGNVELDLGGAAFAAGITEISISATFGNVELTLPLGVQVECTGSGLFGNFDYSAPNIPGYPTDAERIVRITGRSVFSSVQIGAVPSLLTPPAHDAPRRLT